MSDNFIKASRLKIRFSTPQGNIGVEELWDLPLTSSVGKANLDNIAKGLSRQLKTSEEEESFVSESKSTDSATKVAFEIVKYVIQVRLAENKENETRRANNATKTQIRELIEQKRNAKLSEKSEEELTALLASL